MTAAFILRQNVHLTLEVGVRRDRTRLGQNLTALNFFTLRAAKQNTNVVASLTLIEQLAEHFNARAGRLRRRLHAHDFNFVANLDHAAFNTTRHHRTAAGNREHVFDRHEERLINSTFRRRNVRVKRFGELENRRFADRALVAFEGELGRTLDDGNVITREVVLREQFANFHFNEFEQLFVVDHVALVQVDDDVGNANLTGKQNVLAGLGHRAVSGRHDQDRAVHLSSTRNHVLHVVSVARAVNVRIVTICRFVFDVCGVDRDAASLFFRGRVDLIVSLGFTAEVLRERRADGCRQRGLAMVNVTDRADVHVRLRTLKFFLCHF